MKKSKLIIALGLSLLVAACGTTSPRLSSTTLSSGPTGSATVQGQLPASMRVTKINVTVPRSLKVSEANSYYPNADIVWRGDPIGDRYAQVQSIYETAFARGTKGMSGTTPVTLDVQVVRFHSVTEKTRYSTGGVHNNIFLMTVRDARTGQPLAPTRKVEADLPAYGGNEAIEAERRGQTQKVRVTDYLASVIRTELASPSV